MSEFFPQLAQLSDPSARGLALLAMILLLGLGLILALVLARWGRNMALRDREIKRKRPDGVDPWEEAGRRAKPLDDEGDDESGR